MADASLTAPGVLVALGALTLLGLLLRLVARRAGRPVKVLALTLALVGVTATAADAANAWFGYLPRVGDLTAAVGAPAWPVVTGRDLSLGAAGPRARTGGVLTLHLPDRGSGFGDTRALAWLPPQYFSQPTRRFAVGYLLHGSPGVPEDWFRGGQAADVGAALAAAGLPVILVAPQLSHGWLDDPECVDGVREPAASHVLVDVVPGVDAALRTTADRSARLVGGMSAGGYCAVNLGLRHRDVFGSIVDLSGLTRPTHRGGLTALYGPDVAGAAADSPADYARTLPAEPRVRVWLGYGTADGATAPGLRRLDRDLRAAGFPVRLLTHPGHHTFRVWRPLMTQALEEAAPELVAGAGR